MGFAKVISGGPLGRYTIELDYGVSTRTAILAACDALIAQLIFKLAAVQVKIIEADAKELAQQVKVSQAQADYIAESLLPVAPGSPGPSSVVFKFEVQQLTQLRATHAPLRLAKSALEFDIAQVRKRRAYWDAFNPIETRDAWCTDYTEDRAAGAFVATMDIPGESALILLAPGARAWAAGDGILTARELMSPHQAYFNASILPGWQKDKPTYRWGTITALDKPSALCSVALFDAVSSAQRLPINKESALAGVPITYMDCNADPFDVGDRVVVKFLSQDWDQPIVIGFLDNPKQCISHICQNNLITSSLLPGDNGRSSSIFVTRPRVFTNETMDAWTAQTITGKYRVNAGSWVSLVVQDYPGFFVLSNNTLRLYNPSLPASAPSSSVEVFNYQNSLLGAGNPFPDLESAPTAEVNFRLGKGLLSAGDTCEVVLIHNGLVRFTCAVKLTGSAFPANIACSAGNYSAGIFQHSTGGGVIVDDPTPTRMAYELIRETEPAP